MPYSIFRYLTSLSLLCTVSVVSAQIKAKTPMGIEVILHEDGTWSADTAEKKRSTKSTPYLPKNQFNSCKFWRGIEPTEDTGVSLVVAFEKISEGEVSLLSIKPKDTRAYLDTSKPFTFSFKNGARIELTNDSSYNDLYYSVYFGDGYRNSEELNLFRTNKISSVQYYLDGIKVVENITNAQAEEFFRGFNCK